MKIAVLTSDEAHHFCLISLLAASFEIVCAVIEPGIERRKRMKRLRLWSSYFWFTYHHVRRKLLRLDSYRKRYFAAYTDWAALNSVNITKAAWINCASVQASLSAWKPDVTVVCGTSIIRHPTLALCGKVVLNIHGGYLPNYRGNHCIFFALYDQEYDKIGATIHFVNEGIDTGDIIEVVRPEIDPADNAEKLYCRADRLAFFRLCELLHAYGQGHPLPRCQQPPVGRTFKMSDRKPWHDILYWIKRRSGIIVVPRVIQS